MTGGVDLIEDLGSGSGHHFKHFVFYLQSLGGPWKDFKQGNDMLSCFLILPLVVVRSALGWEAGA